jgi:RHS repeat-associated protein
VSELRYSPFGKTRYTSGSTPTKYQFTGQFSNFTDFGLYFYNARWYDSQLGRFAQADSIIPPGVQGLDRYAGMANNPVRFTDPSGHRECESKSGIECDWKTPYLWNRSEEILKKYGGKNDLKAMTKIIDAGSRVYGDYDTLLPALSGVFLGSDTYGPGTLWAAKGTGCAGVGREPHDCAGASDYFSDTGFHSDFQDEHNQLFHVWAYIANTSSPGSSNIVGLIIASFANGFHEVDQSNIAKIGQVFGNQAMMGKGWGTSWQDYTLSLAGIYIGSLITDQVVTPSELAGTISSIIGSQGPGSNGLMQMYQRTYGPLYGSP